MISPGRIGRIEAMTTQPLARRQWRVPAALVLLSAVPVVAGMVRTAELASGAEITEANARFFASPVPVLLHIAGVTLYCVVGAFQFVPGLRGRRSAWHRRAGRVLVPSGLVAALSGLWMTLFYPYGPAVGDVLTVIRVIFGSFMAVAIVLGLTAVRRRDFAAHRAWMIRAYAVAMGAGSQAVIIGGWMIVAGPPTVLANTLLMTLAWLLNLAVAERIIRGSGRAAGRAARADHLVRS
ncbi:membrane protein [Actinokineospora fastidiosa]|uniref:Membrane protein n=2 Tax=Actinokineospora fastidiosa TaxID=1816 RepID=A0A918GSB4_9PSEU|nr:membrane protein [Actinokineospora fastidiosa]